MGKSRKDTKLDTTLAWCLCLFRDFLIKASDVAILQMRKLESSFHSEIIADLGLRKNASVLIDLVISVSNLVLLNYL